MPPWALVERFVVHVTEWLLVCALGVQRCHQEKHSLCHRIPFKLLGLTYVREEFAPVLNMLGLVVDVSQFGQHRVSVHTEKRVAELHESLDQVLTDRCLSAKLSER